MSFMNDLKKQEPNVEKVADHVGAELIHGRFKKGDMFVEVKEDLQCYRTHNVAMELKYKGVPSGIYAGSDHIVYKIGRNYWRAKTEDVVAHIEASPQYRRINGGDGWNSELVLVPYYDFTQLFAFLFRE